MVIKTSRRWRLAGVLALAALGAAACGGGAGGGGGGGGGSSSHTVTVAVVSNSNMIDIEKLTPQFEKKNPGIKVVYDTLNENNERSLIEPTSRRMPISSTP